MINLQTTSSPVVAIAEAVAVLVEQFPGLPICAVDDGQGGLKLGVLGLSLEDEDWFLRPVSPEDITEADQ